jgi:ABC-2 type transport system permease protein
MVGVIARKEIAENLASFRFWVAAVLTVALTVLALLTSAESYEVRRSIWQGRAAAEREALRKFPTYSYLRPLALRPPEPLSIIDQGFDAQFGSALRISVFAIPRSAQEESPGNEFLAAWPALDVTAIVGIVLAFVALLLTCDVFVRESERGTWRPLAAAGVTRRRLLAGKYLGALGTVTGLLVVVSLIGFGFCRTCAGRDLTSSHYVRLAVLVGTYLSYLSLIVLAGLIISLYSRSSSRALVRATLGWLLIVLVAPDLVTSLASDLRSVQGFRWRAQRWESRLWAAWRTELRKVYFRDPLLGRFSGHSPVYVKMDDDAEAVLVRFGSARYYDELTSFYALFVATGQRYGQQVDALHLPAERALRAGQRWTRVWSSVSPRALLGEVVHSLAGTSVADHDRFLAACRSYRRRFVEYLTEKGALHSWRWVTDDRPEDLFPWPAFLGLAPDQVSEREAGRLFSQLGEPALAAARERRLKLIESDPARALALADFPRFAYRDLNLSVALRRAWPEACGLILLNLLAAVFAWRAAGRLA